MSRRIVINATTCVVGGGVQVSTGFIRHALTEARDRSWELLVLASPAVAAQCSTEVVATGFLMKIFDRSPGAIRGGVSTRRRLLKEVAEFRPDLVFTVFGPSYVKFPVPELMGFAVPFVITPCAGCYANHRLIEALAERFRSAVKARFLGHAEEFWVETETARAGLAKVAKVSPERVHVVSNGVNALIAQSATGRAPDPAGEILLLGAGYPHKNHALIGWVAKILETRLVGCPWQFVVTLKPDDALWLRLADEFRKAGMSDRLKNLGVIPVSECAVAYESATMVFHPSLLEVFSATYVETMAMKRPLAVSDRPFAREVCGDAAEYFDPLSPESAADAIVRIFENPARRAALIEAGRTRLSRFPDANAKNGMLCDLIEEFSSRHCHGIKKIS